MRTHPSSHDHVPSFVRSLKPKKMRCSDPLVTPRLSRKAFTAVCSSAELMEARAPPTPEQFTCFGI